MTQPLSFDHLQAMLRQHTTDLPDLRKSSPNTRYTVQGAALGAFGIFFMQSPSFLDYQRQLNQRQGHDNAQTLFGVDPIPCDNQVRKLLDPIAPSSFNPVFFEVFEHLEQQYWLNPWRVLDHQLLVSLDGTQYFSSKKLHCQNCLTRQLANGQALYYHTAITPVIVSPIASNGRDIRNAVLQNLMPLLWYGLVDQAIAYLKSLPESEIKNEDERIHLVQYLAKNHPMIPAYAVRRELGLRNSSNRGEKANDLLVAERQKHNGMSWSPSGSVALASVTALKHNREYHKWFRERKIAFTLAS